MEQFLFKGQNALIIAASKGIGFAIAKCLYKEGANIFLNSNNIDNLVISQRELMSLQSCENQRIHLVPFDINNQEAVNLGIDHVLTLSQNRIDILVTNSVNFQYGPFLELKEGDWDTAVLIKFKAVNRIIQRIIPLMIQNGYGQIVNIGSIDSKEPQFGFSPAICVRLLVSGYLKSLADNSAYAGVRVNQVLCGYIMTETLKAYLEKKAKSKSTGKENLEMEMINKIPMKRFAHPDEIGKVVKFLCSNDSTYITGQSIVVDGGLIRSLT